VAITVAVQCFSRCFKLVKDHQQLQPHFLLPVAHLLPAISLVALSLTGCNGTLAVVILTIAVTVIGSYASGFFQSPMDVAPNFAGKKIPSTATSRWLLVLSIKMWL
jgi:hypothetical protein